MARQHLMTWYPGTHRWMKMYQGKRYAVSCKQLKVPPTKEASWKAANEWWKQKLAEIESAPESHPHEVFLEMLAMRRDWAARHGQMDLANDLSQQIEEAKGLTEGDEGPVPDDPEIAKNIEVARLMGIEVPDNLDPEIASHFFGSRRIWQDRLARDEGEQTPKDRTIEAQVERWVAFQQKSAEAGKISPDHADNNRIVLNHFKQFMNGASPVDAITAQRLHDFFLLCLKKVAERRNDPKKKAGWSIDYAKNVFSIARRFTGYLAETGLIALPSNIHSKAFRFNAGAKAIPTMAVEQFRTLVSEATGQLKLHLLLMANCGMNQIDISDLKQSEVDWQGGRITRKRSKVEDSADAPVVNWKLWPITFDLLKKHRSSDPHYALLTETGKPWVRKHLRESDGKLSKADGIASCYAHLKEKTKIKAPLKLIRKTSASLIESHKEYGRYKSHFLGHSPRSIADKHYAAPSVPLFDEIVNWLGQQYGFIPKPEKANEANQ